MSFHDCSSRAPRGRLGRLVRLRRSLRPGTLRDDLLERRLLPTVVPVFYADPTSSGFDQAVSDSIVNQEDTQTNNGINGGGASAGSSITNNFINGVSVTETGSLDITDAVPAATSGDSIQKVEFYDTQMNSDSVQTDANGPYTLTGGPFGSERANLFQGTNATTPNFFSFNIKNSY